MPLIRTLTGLEEARNNYKGNRCGLVPTMGALHLGHLALIEKALAENEVVWVSIFVNPTQFNNLNDLENYPKSLNADVDAIHSIHPKINIFAPTVLEMYPQKIEANSHIFYGLETVMEGADRPGHFEGVITIVSKLFDVVKPDCAYFGEKDFQQLLIIKNWTKTNRPSTKIIACPIVREANGLAMSSRNNLLSKEARQEAGFIFKTLNYCVQKLRTSTEILAEIKRVFASHPSFTLHYAICVDEDSLQEVSQIDPYKNQRLFIAASVEGVRLIDNIALK